MRRTACVAYLALVAVVPAAYVPAADCTRYVAPTGHDSGSGSAAQPWQTLQHAADSVQPGDTVCVAAGTYTEEVVLAVSGSAAAPITFTGASAGVQVAGALELAQGTSHIRLDGFTVSGFTVWGVTLLGDNQDVVLSSLTVSGGEAGIHLTVGDSGTPPVYGPVSHVVIEDSSVSGAEYTAVDCTPGPCDNLTLRRLTVTSGGGQAGFAGDGIAVERGEYVVVEDCNVHDVGGDGIDVGSRDLGTQVAGVAVRRNRVARTGTNGIKVWAGGEVVNNLVWDAGDTALVLESGSYRVVNNTIASLTGYTYLVTLGNYDNELASSVEAYDNIFYNDNPANGGTLVYVPLHGSLTADHNLYFNSYRESDVICVDYLGDGECFSSDDISDGTWTAHSGQGQHSHYADPLFVDAGQDDYHLSQASPAVDAGSAAEAPADDVDGLPRDASPDIGAYERRSSSSCQVGCSASVPATAEAGAAVSFHATVTATGCSTQPVVQWSFGDGASSGTADASHSYATAGTYQWSLTVTADQQECRRSGSITVAGAGPGGGYRYLIPAVIHGPGAAGTQWRTSVAALNLAGSAAAISLTLVGDGSPLQASTSLAARSSAEWSDVVAGLLAAPTGSSTAGALQVASDRPLLLTSRTFNQAAAGTYGQYLPALTTANALSTGDDGYLLHLKGGSGFRSNVGFANLGTTACTVRVRVYGSGGGALGSPVDTTVAAGHWRQVNDVFAAAGAGSPGLAWAEVQLQSGDGPFWAYASVVDSATGDATTIPVLVP